jgi:hypothetical protein
VTFRKEHRLRVIDRRVLRRIIVSGRDNMTGITRSLVTAVVV